MITTENYFVMVWGLHAVSTVDFIHSFTHSTNIHLRRYHTSGKDIVPNQKDYICLVGMRVLYIYLLVNSKLGKLL